MEEKVDLSSGNPLAVLEQQTFFYSPGPWQEGLFY